MAKQQSGLLITLEGGEGAGKSTQVLRLKNHFIKLGKDVVVLREPGGTSISEQIRDVVLAKKNVGMAFTTEVLLFQAARAQIYREIVLPSLALGKVVLMDRSRDSSVVYQGKVRGFGVDLIEQLNDISTKKTYPDLTFLLDIAPDIGLKRNFETGLANRMEMEDLSFHQKVRQAYIELAKEDLAKHGSEARWRIVDATQELNEITKQLWQEIIAVIKKHQLSDWQDQLEQVDLEYIEE